MPRTEQEAFRDFLAKLTPTPFETESAKRHRASIEACLVKRFDMQQFFRTGSFGNGTSIAGYSDVDYFASISKKHLSQNSKLALRKVWYALDKRFPNTGVRVRVPAIIVPFGISGKETTEVVPAIYLGKSNSGYKIYDIADRSGGWKKSSPEAHNKYIRSIDTRLDEKAKPLIRFIKAWKYFRKVPISSFYLELVIAKYLEDESTIDYCIDINSILNQLEANGLQSVQDPLGISGSIKHCDFLLHHRMAKNALKTALSLVKNARRAESNDNSRLAFICWNRLFRGKFPSYYR